MKDDCSVKVNLVDSKENKGSKLADKSVRAYLDVEKAKKMLGGGGGDGGSGAILPLSDYLDVSNPTVLTDKDGLISAIEDGNGFYMVDPYYGPLILHGAIDDDTIKLSSSPALSDQQLLSVKLAFDKNTGTLDPTKMGSTAFGFPNHTTIDNDTILGLGKLTIHIGSNTYEYDGSQDVNITIANGENMGF